MKKLFALIVTVMILTVSIAVAETDLSSMSYNDLIALQKKVNAEIMSRPEWKEVKVPAGTWKVGDDIPEGTYSIKTDAVLCTIQIWNGEQGDFSNYVDMKIISESESVGKIELKAGWIIEFTSSVTFTPPVLLGF